MTEYLLGKCTPRRRESSLGSSTLAHRQLHRELSKLLGRRTQPSKPSTDPFGNQSLLSERDLEDKGSLWLLVDRTLLQDSWRNLD